MLSPQSIVRQKVKQIHPLQTYHDQLEHKITDVHRHEQLLKRH